MSVRIMRRYAFLLALLLTVTIFRCSSSMRQSTDEFCKAGNGSKARPLICVDERNLTASPAVAHVFDVEPDGDLPSSRTVVVHWFTQHTADLRIDFKDTSCTEPVQCDGHGHCWAKVKRLSTATEHRQCRYGMTLGDGKLDPDGDLVVDPCCWRY